MELTNDTQSLLEQTVTMITQFMAGMETAAFQQDGFSELSMRQVFYMETISRLGQPNFSELAETLTISRPSVTVLVGKLVRKGFVQKVQDGQDRRSFRLLLTERGRQFIHIHKNMHRKIVEALISHLNEGEIEQLAGLLKKAIGL